MFTCCWSAKGGSGVTVVAAALALATSATTSTALVDLCGDLPAALGLPEPNGAGAAEMSRGGDVSRAARALVAVAPTLSLLPRGRGPLEFSGVPQLSELADEVIVDVGCLDRANGPRGSLVAGSARSLLVARPCYLGLRRAARLPLRPHGIVLVVEPHRALRRDDVAAIVGAPVVAEVPIDPAIARAVDAGLLASRCPASLRDALAEAS